MIQFHGGPITPLSCAIKVWTNRHAMISHAHPEQVEIAFAKARTVRFDNGAFSKFKSNQEPDWEAYYEFVDEWRLHPGFDGAIIPDKIDGNEADNDVLIQQWPFKFGVGIPVWHLHESLDRLNTLIDTFPIVALGSSGEFWKLKSPQWWRRMNEAMSVCCDELGRPRTKLHGLRMQDWRIFTKYPLAYTDSVTAAINIGIDKNWPAEDADQYYSIDGYFWPKHRYTPKSKEARAQVIADIVEHYTSPPIWEGALKRLTTKREAQF